MYKYQDKKEYQILVEKMSPKKTLFSDCFKSFLFGGTICLIGEIIFNIFVKLNINKDVSTIYSTIILIFLGSYLTAIGVYDKLANIGGAGCSIPITGFANSVTSATLEYKTEGFILGIGSKMFSIAGAVIVYGILFSIFLGLFYYVLN